MLFSGGFIDAVWAPGEKRECRFVRRARTILDPPAAGPHQASVPRATAHTLRGSSAAAQVFIGRDLDKKALIDGFMDCKCSEELRFKKGDKVRARVGKAMQDEMADGYCAGLVIQTWDAGNAYRIELQNEQKTNVWGPIDEDTFVKAGIAA